MDDSSGPQTGNVESAGAVPAGATVEALARALALYDYRRGGFGETSAHLQRVTRLALGLARVVAPQLVVDPALEHGFRLHDIGMIGVSSAIHVKHGPLSPDEMAEVREHPYLGEQIAAPVWTRSGVVRQVIASHHERWDGSGYPSGLAASDIPLAARIFAVVDAYDAMTRNQPYRDAIPEELALAEIREKAGSQFDPTIAVQFADIWPELKRESPPAATASP